jgi:hypothetical protein
MAYFILFFQVFAVADNGLGLRGTCDYTCTAREITKLVAEGHRNSIPVNFSGGGW